jgi:putative FmdB family regulatory protein
VPAGAALTMPIYEYECRKCGVFDYSQSLSDQPLSRCPKCRSKVTKLISASAFHLKGGGWYSDGYDKKGDGSKKSAAAESESSTSASGDGDAAPAPAPAVKDTAAADSKSTGKKTAKKTATARTGKAAST